MADIENRRMTVPAAELAYDVRPAPGSTEPPLFILGCPMGADGFVTLAGHFGDRTVVTYDPRGVGRSTRTDGAPQTTPDEHADDLHRLIEAVGGPVDMFATSGGAVNALALVAQHPDDVRTLVAHEPPAVQEVPDREQALAIAKGIHDLYLREGSGPAMVRFILFVTHKGTFDEGFLDQPAPDPSAFGMSSEDDGSRDDALLGQNLLSCTHYVADVDAVRGASTRTVLAVGAASEDQAASRATYGLGERLGSPPVVFPGDHGGFLGGEHGQTGEPDAFAAALREVLDRQS